MKKKQPFNLYERKELGKLELSKEVVITLMGIGTIAFFVFGFFFTQLSTQFTGNVGFNSTDTIFIPIALFFGTLVLHELIHGVFISIYGGKPRYGAGIAYFIFPYFYTTTNTIFLRNKFIVILIAPLILISLVAIGLMVAFPSFAHWIFLPFLINALGAVGDLWMTRELLRYPEHVLLEDRKTGTIIYGKETDKSVNISTSGFGSRIFIVFTLCFFAMGLVLNIALIPLHFLGLESFSIGPINIHYTIFGYHSFEGGFGFTFFLLPTLAISAITGLVYAIIKTCKLRNDAMTE